MARSSVSIAIFTPAQNPRGLARMIFIESVDLMVLIRGCLGDDIRYHNVQSTTRIEKHMAIKTLMADATFLSELSVYGPATAARRKPSPAEAQAYCRRLASSHYENFTVAS